MITKRVRSWTGFLKAIEAVRKDYAKTSRKLDGGQIYERDNLILFRGQANSRWKLQTTLERTTEKEFHIFDYVAGAVQQAHEIEAFTGEKWNLPNREGLEKEMKKNDHYFSPYLPAYEYLVYLRHHGYPSPLLDWTQSPFIAAYFALIDQGADSAAVYCYIERPQGIKGGQLDKPEITLKGPFVKTHKRHFVQKAWYTLATQWDEKTERHYFCSHEPVFDAEEQEYKVTEQDVLIKIVLPTNLRKEALNYLNDFNINHFTLFQSEESLVKALADKRFLS